MCTGIYNNNDTLKKLKEQFTLSRDLYYNYLLSLMGNQWRNIYKGMLERVRSNEKSLLCIRNFSNFLKKTNFSNFLEKSLNQKHKGNFVGDGISDTLGKKVGEKLWTNLLEKVKKNKEKREKKKLVKKLRELLVLCQEFVRMGKKRTSVRKRNSRKSRK